MVHHGPDFAPAFVGLFTIFVIVAVLLVTVIEILAFCKIFSKAGYCWAFGLLGLVPFGVLVMILILAFADWPISRELRTLKPPVPGV